MKAHKILCQSKTIRCFMTAYDCLPKACSHLPDLKWFKMYLRGRNGVNSPPPPSPDA